MSDAILDPAELEAIQDAIRESAPRKGADTPNLEATRLALIADERLAELARPALINLATRWTRRAPRALRPHLPGAWQLDVVGAETIDGATAKEELRNGWVAGGKSDPAEVVIAVHGPVIDVAAARRCGATEPSATAARAPSTIALRLFNPVGRAVFDSWTVAWQEMFDRELSPSNELGIVSRLIEARTVVRVAVALGGSLAGNVHIYARPETLVTRPTALAAIKAKTAAIAIALANVPVEVIAELGTLRLPLSELRSLEPGTTYTLPTFVDSRVPVYCGGVLKAWARPVVCRGVLAVQIVSVVHGQGIQS